MIINEPKEARLQRLAEYEICKKRGHCPGFPGLGDFSLCSFCGTRYRMVTTMEEDISTVPTHINVPVPGTNCVKTIEAPLDKST